MDTFEKRNVHTDWEVAFGDGMVDVKFEQFEGYGRFTVDATKDELNIWWAVLRLQVPNLEMEKLILPNYELRVEAKIKVSHAPRRVNLHFNHSRTTDYHSHLKEYDIHNTSEWHTISMTTNDFEVLLEDKVNVQLALMDWGNEVYTVDIDYVKVDIVPKDFGTKDLGNPQAYHPKVPNTNSFTHNLKINEGATLDTQYPERNFYGWHDPFAPDNRLLSVSTDQMVILKTDFKEYTALEPDGLGVLKMTLHHLENSSDFKKDFGFLRLVEIIGGPDDWQEKEVTFKSFDAGPKPVLNDQMVIDINPATSLNKEIYFTISEAVLKRLFSGKTKGLALIPLGAINASFYSNDTAATQLAPKIYFNIK